MVMLPYQPFLENTGHELVAISEIYVKARSQYCVNMNCIHPSVYRMKPHLNG